MPYQKPVKRSQNHINVANVVEKKAQIHSCRKKSAYKTRHRMHRHRKQETKNSD